ncbi:MAG TPA: BadF/BadG/BcrA/BcrD ATPase family protein [Terriglobia bacterium]|nr:BadF/BadG/BcrA/BcrD ATPase family protein [Terriglobia bacterium]
MRFFLGIDGGGTRTTAWVADERGRVVGHAVAGPSNPLKVGFAACEREILRAAKAAVAAGLSRHRSGSGGVKPPLHAVVIGLAGVDRPPVHSRVLKGIRKSLGAQNILLTSDAAIALHAAIGNSPGIMVISGTGSIAYARDDQGNAFRSGGWGATFDDAGSGFDLGRRAIMAALRDYDGRGHHTNLGASICRALRLRDITQVILKPLTAQDIAALFPVVLKAAQRRDAVARYMLDAAAYELSELAFALIDRLRWKNRAFPVVCAGGIFSASPRVCKMFSMFVRNVAPRARVILLRRQPVEGALAMARELALSQNSAG